MPKHLFGFFYKDRIPGADSFDGLSTAQNSVSPSLRMSGWIQSGIRGTYGACDKKSSL